METTTQNPLTLSAAAEANLGTGVLLLCKEALVSAIQDRRLERGHLRVLAAIANCINSRTAKAWPGRVAISAMTGLSVRAVSNTLLELRKLGYLIADREAVEEANNRRLTVYTFGNIDHDAIRREITSFVNRMRTARQEVPAGGDGSRPEVTAHGEVSGPKITAHGDVLRPEVTAHGAQKSPPTVDSNSKKELRRKREEEGRTHAVNVCRGSPHLNTAGEFVISEERGLLIPADTVEKWRTRFPYIPDLEADMQRLASFILAKGSLHPGWQYPEAWMAGCLSDNNQQAANKAKITSAKIASGTRTQPTKTFKR